MTPPRLSPLDWVSSYNTKGMSNAGRSRISKFNLFANQVLRKDQAAQGAHTWVAHMGRAHADVYEGIPGLAQSQRAISVYVSDVAPDTATGLHLPTAFAPIDRTRLKKAGHYPVDRWPHLKDKRFIAFEELLGVLDTAGLTRIG